MLNVKFRGDCHHDNRPFRVLEKKLITLINDIYKEYLYTKKEWAPALHSGVNPYLLKNNH